MRRLQNPSTPGSKTKICSSLRFSTPGHNYGNWTELKSYNVKYDRREKSTSNSHTITFVLEVRRSGINRASETRVHYSWWWPFRFFLNVGILVHTSKEISYFDVTSAGKDAVLCSQGPKKDRRPIFRCYLMLETWADWQQQQWAICRPPPILAFCDPPNPTQPSLSNP